MQLNNTHIPLHNSHQTQRQEFKYLLELIAQRRLTEIFDFLELKGWKPEQITNLIRKLSFKKPPDKALILKANPSQQKEVP